MELSRCQYLHLIVALKFQVEWQFQIQKLKITKFSSTVSFASVWSKVPSSWRMFTSNMTVFVRFLHRRFSTIVTHIIIGFLFLSQLLLGTIFHMTNNVAFEFGVRRASRCYKWYIFSSLSNKGCFHLSFTTLWLTRFSCLSLLLLSVNFLMHVYSR